MSLRHILIASALLALPLTAAAEDDSGLSDAQTSYTGAIMLEGEVDVDFGGVSTGDWGVDDQTSYAYFSGNTLYAGAEDVDGNAVDAIIEFFWFESSIDRGSDFYVAIIKARTSPAVDEGWYLTTDDRPVLSVLAETDISRENGAFRWDWSVPFENYGLESYGEVSMTTAYGIGGSAEGAAMVAETYDEDGVKAEVEVQSKGYVSTEYKVQTQYQVTLYRWEMDVDGSPGDMEWNFTLHNQDRDEDNAYHEYFLVMQVDEGETFTIDRFDIGGAVNGYWWWDETSLGISLDTVTLSAPAYDEGDDDDDDDDGDDDTGWGDDTGWDDGDDDDDDGDDDDDDSSDDDDDGTGDATFNNLGPDDDDGGDGGVTIFSCSAIPGATFGVGWLALGLVALRRRED